MDDLRAVTAMRASEAAASGDGGGVGNVENARIEILRHVEREHEADRRTSCQSLTLDAGDTSQRGGSDFRATDRTSVAPSPPAAAISARFTEAPPFEERAAAPEAPEAPHAPAGGVNTLDHRLLFTSSKGSCVWSVDKVMFGRGNSVPEGAVPRAFPHRISPWGGSFAHVTVGERPRVERGRTSSSGLPSRKFEGRIRCGPQGDRPRRQRRACVSTTMRKPKSQMRMRQYQIRRPDDIGQNIIIWLLLPAASCCLMQKESGMRGDGVTHDVVDRAARVVRRGPRVRAPTRRRRRLRQPHVRSSCSSRRGGRRRRRRRAAADACDARARGSGDRQ